MTEVTDMIQRNRRHRPADFDVSFLVPGLPFFEQVGQILSDAIGRLFERISDGLARLRHRIRAGHDHVRPASRKPEVAVTPAHPRVETPEAENV